MPHADEERMAPGSLRNVEHFYRTIAGCDYLPVGEANPLAAKLTEQLIAGSPVCRFIFSPLRVELNGDFRRQLVCDTFHGHSSYSKLIDESPNDFSNHCSGADRLANQGGVSGCSRFLSGSPTGPRTRCDS